MRGNYLNYTVKHIDNKPLHAEPTSVATMYIQLGQIHKGGSIYACKSIIVKERIELLTYNTIKKTNADHRSKCPE